MLVRVLGYDPTCVSHCLILVVFHLLVYDLSVAEYVPRGVLTSLTSLKSSRVACLPIAYVDQDNDVSGSIINVGSSMYRGKG